MQNNPSALTPFTPRLDWSDPTFEECYQSICPKTFALRFFNSTYSLVYGAGFYSFFNNYDSGCLLTRNCQSLIVSLEQSQAIYMYGLGTVAAENMVEVDLVALVPQAYNANSFTSNVAVFEYP
jgi:glucan 1,3-beta-glucosidase